MVSRFERPTVAPRPGGRTSHRQQASHRQQGYALILALFVLIITLTVGGVIALALQFRMERLRRETSTIQLTALLDGGLSHAVAELRDNPSWRGTGGPIPLGDGFYGARTELVGVDLILIRLTAVWGREGRAAEADYDRLTRRVVSWRPMPFDPHDPLGLGD